MLYDGQPHDFKTVKEKLYMKAEIIFNLLKKFLFLFLVEFVSKVILPFKINKKS